ncbi:MAG: HAMP domain-containing protein [Myxococcaceae bacterium]|nr:HAMP domain-containing protein [Myxococcaceae bacterium]
MRLSLATRIFLGYAVVLVTFGAVSLFSVTELHRGQVEIRLLSEGYLALSQTAANLDSLQKNQANDTTRLREQSDVAVRRVTIQLARRYFFEQMDRQLDEALSLIRRLEEFAPADEQIFIDDARRRLLELKTKYAAYRETADAAWEVLEQPSPDATTASLLLDRLQVAETALGATIKLLHSSLEARTRQRVALTQERERRTGVAIIGLSVLAIAVGLLATGIAARSLRPVRTLIDGVSRISRGDYSAKLGISGDDEIAVLAREFDAMARSLAEREAQLAQKQEALLRAERLAAAGRVSAQVAHEVRNPLSSIGLNAELLGDQLESASFADPQDASEARRLLAAVTREVDRITEITEEYLKLARLPAPALRSEDLVAIVQSVIGFSREELTRAKVNVTAALPPGPLLIQADEGQLRQVFLNLFRNAREAMTSGGALEVSVAVEGREAVVRVEDTGPGLPPAVRERLFEPFFSTKDRGTGIGLSLSRQIVEAHGGRIGIDESVQQGTAFVMRFPLA